MGRQLGALIVMVLILTVLNLGACGRDDPPPSNQTMNQIHLQDSTEERLRRLEEKQREACEKQEKAKGRSPVASMVLCR